MNLPQSGVFAPAARVMIFLSVTPRTGAGCCTKTVITGCAPVEQGATLFFIPDSRIARCHETGNKQAYMFFNLPLFVSV